eukprot:Gb_00990 [translate_table: standard]
MNAFTGFIGVTLRLKCYASITPLTKVPCVIS